MTHGVERGAPSRITRLNQRIMPRITPIHVWAYRAMHRRLVDKATGGTPVVLVTTIGWRTGKPRTVALGHLPGGPDVIVAATNGGLEPLPSSILNLEADPRCWVQLGSERFEARAVLEGDEWEEHWTRLNSAFPIYDQAHRLAGRPVPLVRLQRVETCGETENPATAAGRTR